MSNRVAVIALGAVLTGLLVGVVVAGSGGDGGSKSTDTAPPDLTVPGSSAGTLTDTKTSTTKKNAGKGTTDQSSTPSDQSGGAAAPPSQPDTGGAGAAPAQPQTGGQNKDQQPSSGGSAAPRFNEFCQQNPSAC